MSKVPYHNDTDKFVHIGSVTIAPGATRDVEETHLAEYSKPKESAPAAPDAIADLLAGTAAEVIAKLPGLSAADLEQVELREQEGKNRKTVLAAISEALLNLAAQNLAEQIALMSDADLTAALEEAKTDINVDADYLAALEAEAASRNPGGAA
jgi:hypothetical protein